jgi:hypothetical protein
MVWDHKVRGSNPFAPTNFKEQYMNMLSAILAVFLLVAPTPKTVPTRAYRVSSVDPILVSKFTEGRPVVIGPDGAARGCPDLPGIGTFVRPEGKSYPNMFENVNSGFVMSTKDRAFTIACLKIE